MNNKERIDEFKRIYAYISKYDFSDIKLYLDGTEIKWKDKEYETCMKIVAFLSKYGKIKEVKE